MFELGKILGALLLPPGTFILTFALAAALGIREGRREGSRGASRAASAICASSSVLLYALSLSPVAGLLARPLEDRYPYLAGASAARAVVVLGGGHVEGSPAAGGRAELARASAMRAAFGARLALAAGLPIIYSGGSVFEPKGALPEADIARDFIADFGLPRDRIFAEGQSRDTYENATLTAALVAATGEGGVSADSRPVALVTSALHMPRSVLAFEKAGMAVIPAPTDFRADRGGLGLDDFLPSAGALQLSYDALHEYVGLAYYALR